MILQQQHNRNKQRRREENACEVHGRKMGKKVDKENGKSVATSNLLSSKLYALYAFHMLNFVCARSYWQVKAPFISATIIRKLC